MPIMLHVPVPPGHQQHKVLSPTQGRSNPSSPASSPTLPPITEKPSRLSPRKIVSHKSDAQLETFRGRMRPRVQSSRGLNRGHQSADAIELSPQSPTVPMIRVRSRPSARDLTASSSPPRAQVSKGLPKVTMEPPVDLEVDTQYCPAAGGVAPCWIVWATWKYNQGMDSEYDFRQWDFLALHLPNAPANEYLASLYMLGAENGKLWFVMPPEGGDFAVSIVRDAKLVSMVMKKKEGEGPRYTSYVDRVKQHFGSFLPLASCTLVAPRDAQYVGIQKIVPAGSTAHTEVKSAVTTFPKLSTKLGQGPSRVTITEETSCRVSAAESGPAAGKLRHTHSWHTQRNLVIATAKDGKGAIDLNHDHVL